MDMIWSPSTFKLFLGVLNREGPMIGIEFFLLAPSVIGPYGEVLRIPI